MRYDKRGKYFRTVDVTPPLYPRTAPLNQLVGATRFPRGWPARGRLRRRYRRAAARVAIEMVTLLNKAVNVNETSHESVVETVPAGNAENT